MLYYPSNGSSTLRAPCSGCTFDGYFIIAIKYNINTIEHGSCIQHSSLYKCDPICENRPIGANSECSVHARKHENYILWRRLPSDYTSNSLSFETKIASYFVVVSEIATRLRLGARVHGNTEVRNADHYAEVSERVIL